MILRPGRRGVVLLHTLVFIALLAMAAAVVIRWAFARHVLAKKSLDGFVGKGVLQGIEARLASCLDGCTITDCDPLASTPAGCAATCITDAKTGVQVTTIGLTRKCKASGQIGISFSETSLGAPPPCKVEIKLLPGSDPAVSSPVDPAILVACP